MLGFLCRFLPRENHFFDPLPRGIELPHEADIHTQIGATASTFAQASPDRRVTFEIVPQLVLETHIGGEGKFGQAGTGVASSTLRLMADILAG